MPPGILSRAAGAVLALVSVPALALNGLNLIGFGAVSNALGGADVALARDTSVLNVNPAGLTGTGRRADGYAASAYALDIAHEDQFGNNKRVSNPWTLYGGGGYAQPLGDTGLHVGVGFFVQGGAGGVYRGLHTAFGTTDELSSLFGITRVVPGVAWHASDKLSLGLSVGFNEVQGSERVFPDTSVLLPGGGVFAGYKIDRLRASQETLKLGAQYRASPNLTLGLVYTTKTAFHLTSRNMQVNFAALGAGTVTYRDVRFDGLALPRQLEVGAAWQVSPETLVSVEYGWLNWSDAMRRATLVASNPDVATVPSSLTISNSLNWRDQHVIAVGVEHALNPRLRLRAGFNYARTPVPPETMQPVLAAIHERHITGGVGYDLDRHWKLSGAFELQPGNRVTYTNPGLPFGVDTVARNRYIGLIGMVSYLWD